MREPAFWQVRDLHTRASAPLTRSLLKPVSWVYATSVRRRIARTRPEASGVPVICIGNLTLGGAGKTPVAAAIRETLQSHRIRTATLSRGYGGILHGPYRVHPTNNSARAVGDEPLMLAATGESWIARDRIAGAQAMRAAGVQAIIMDDGHQNPLLSKSLSFVVIDAANPFGNGLVFPCGPLRETPREGLARADAVVLMGNGPAPKVAIDSGLPVLRAQLKPLVAVEPGQYVAFAGIGRPRRFFESLKAHDGVELGEEVAFPDHHAYRESELRQLAALAARHSARLITTEKDHARLPADWRDKISAAPVRAVFEQPEELDRILARVFPSVA